MASQAASSPLALDHAASESHAVARCCEALVGVLDKPAGQEAFPGSPKPGSGPSPDSTNTPPLPHYYRNPRKRKSLSQKNRFRPAETNNLPPLTPARIRASRETRAGIARSFASGLI